MPTIITASGAADLLALVPEVAGFTPRNSLVLVAFRGTRTCGAFQFDLPRSSARSVRAAAATAMIGMLTRLESVDAVVPVCYIDDRFGAHIPHGTVVDAIVERAEQAGLEVRDALCVAADGWGSYFDAGCPPGGFHLAEITASTAARSILDLGSRVVGDQHTVPPVPAVDLATTERIARLVGRMLAVPPDAEFTAIAVDLPEFLEGVLEELRDEGWAAVPDRVVAMLIVMAQAPADRDVLLFQSAFDLHMGRLTQEFNGSWNEGPPPALPPRERTGIEGILMGEGRRPSPERVELAIGLMSGLVVRSPRSLRAPVLTMLAWLHWALGRGSVAGGYLDEALEVDPRYGLAGLLDTMLHRGMLPAWAFRPAESESDSGTGTDEREDGVSDR